MRKFQIDKEACHSEDWVLGIRYWDPDPGIWELEFGIYVGSVL